MSIHLTSKEVDDLCAPLTQGAAQKRYLEKVLGIPVFARRPDGMPIVGRAVAEERLANKQPSTPSKSGFNWSK